MGTLRSGLGSSEFGGDSLGRKLGAVGDKGGGGVELEQVTSKIIAGAKDINTYLLCFASFSSATLRWTKSSSSKSKGKISIPVAPADKQQGQ